MTPRYFIKSLRRAPRAQDQPAPIGSLKEFFHRQQLWVRQPVPLATHHFIATKLLASGYDLRWIARSHDGQWTLSLRADKGAGRRGRTAIRRVIGSSIRALGSDIVPEDILVHRRRQVFDVVFLCEGGRSGSLRFRSGKATYEVSRPQG